MDRSYKYLISDERRFVIPLIMKSGTGTLRGYFTPDNLPSKGMINKGYKVRHISSVVPSKEAQDKIQQGYTSAVFIREPLARLVSCYAQKIEYYYNPLAPKTIGIKHPRLNRFTSFEQFVNIVCSTPDHEADAHFRSQHYNLIEGVTAYRLDNFKDGFDTFRSKAGLPLHEYKVRNTTKQKRKDIADYYTAELRLKVISRYKTDIKYYESLTV